ncbi:MAG: EamA family transporter [Pseudomonadota bacterium]
MPAILSDPAESARRRATLIGFGAVLLWATLALFAAASGNVPPLQLNAMAFLIGGSLGLVMMAQRGTTRTVLAQPLRVIAFGTIGLFGFHFLFFTAMRNAPPVEASLINYTWPLLIVVFSALLPGERLGWHHVAGALIGLAGTAILVTGGEGPAGGGTALGYLAACGSALFWSSYSVLSRRFGHVPTDTVTLFCLSTAALSAVCHFAFETTVWPDTATEWLAVLALGLGPVGGAFFLWDHGVKSGDIQVLGASAYAAPLLSTLLLIAFGFGALTWPVALACVAITGGAVLAAKDLLFRKH